MLNNEKIQYVPRDTQGRNLLVLLFPLTPSASILASFYFLLLLIDM